MPHPEHGVCMRENNWEYALDCSAGNGNYYAADRGEAYLSYREKGLGISWDGSDMPKWREQLDLVARPAARVVAEQGVYYTLSGSEDEEPVADAGAAEEFATPSPPAWLMRLVGDRAGAELVGLSTVGAGFRTFPQKFEAVVRR